MYTPYGLLSLGFRFDEASGLLKGCRSHQNGAWLRHLLHACGEVRGLACGIVLHPQVVADGMDDHFTGIETDANVDFVPRLAPKRSNAFAHGERGIAGSHCVLLISEGRAEHCHDAVATCLIDETVILVDGLH